MRKRTGPTRKERREEAERLLMALLRTPKSRNGLIAAVASKGVTKHFVFGFLSENVHNGSVTMLRSTNPVQYQATDTIVTEKPAQSVFPSWLDPRDLPTSVARRVFINGRATKSSGVQST